MKWTLDDVDGPGEFFIYQTSGFGEIQRILSSTDTGASYTIPKNTHAHGNWAFTRQGVYCLGFTRSATLTGGNQAVSDEVTLAVAVGQTDPRPVDPTHCQGSQTPDPEPDPEAVATMVTATQVTQVYGQAANLTVTVSPNATGKVTVNTGTQTVSGNLVGGKATLGGLHHPVE